MDSISFLRRKVICLLLVKQSKNIRLTILKNRKDMKRKEIINAVMNSDLTYEQKKYIVEQINRNNLVDSVTVILKMLGLGTKIMSLLD